MLTPRSVPFGGPALPALKAYEEVASPAMPIWVLLMNIPEGSLGHRYEEMIDVATVVNWRKPRLYPATVWLSNKTCMFHELYIACCSSIGRIETNPLMASTSAEAA